MEAITLEQASFLAEIVGVFVIVVSLVYLSLQVRQNTGQMQSEAEDSVWSLIFDAYMPVYEGRNAEILRLGLDGATELEPNDAFVFNLLMWRQAGSMRLALYHIDDGTLSGGTLAFVKRHYQEIFALAAGGREWFDDAKKKGLMSPAELQQLGLTE